MIHLVRTGACIAAAASALAIGFAFWQHESKIGPAATHAAVTQPQFVESRAPLIDKRNAVTPQAAAVAETETAPIALAKLAMALHGGKPNSPGLASAALLSAPSHALAFAEPVDGPTTSVPEIHPSTMMSVPPAAAGVAAQQLFSRGLLALADGDIAGARRILQRAAGAGDTRALVLLGSAYDPASLQRMNVRGAKGDAALARQYYAKAIAAGMNDARSRMAALDASSD